MNAANSQVARCIIAIAKSRALNVAGIVRRSELIQELERLGVDFVGVESPELPKQIQSATGGMPISLGLDAVGGPAAATIAGALSPGAHFVSYAWLGGLPIYLPQGDLIGKQLNIRGFWMYYEEFLPKIREVVVAGDAAYNDVHIHLGESNADSRKEWIAALDMIETLKPRAVVAGHKRPGRPDAPEIVGETRQYIHDFDRIAANTQTAKELYDQMLAIYPDRVNPAVLWNSARAVKG